MQSSVDNIIRADRYSGTPTRAGGCGCGSSGGCGCGTLATPDSLVGLERPRYFPRQIVGPEDLNQGLRYVTDRMRRHNRFLHGWGIACGLRVEPCGPNEDGSPSCRVRVTAGYALDPYGDEIFVPEPVVVDVCAADPAGALMCVPSGDPWCAPVPVPPGDGPRYLAIRHIEQPVKPVRAPTGCSCSDAACEHSRIRDWYEFALLDELPSHYDWPCGDIDEYCSTVATCPPCPESGWVVLAVVYGDGATIAELGGEQSRRYLLSLANFCEHCENSFGRDERAVLVGRPANIYIATAAAQPDTTVSFDYYEGSQRVRASIAMAEADLVGTTAGELKTLLADVVLFDTATGQPVLLDDGSTLTAATILAHSPLRADSVIDSADDLRVRVGRPSIDASAYRAAMAELDDLLDDGGRAAFEERALGNLDRLGELDVEALSGISRANAAKLRAVGIDTLAQLRAARRLPDDLSAPAMAKATRFRELSFGRAG